MENINQTFLRVLISEKTVSICAHQFNSLHQRIFPCIDDFEKFLLSETEQEQKECTKRIVQNLLFNSQAHLCPEVYNALIDTEANYPASDASFIPQDHVVHSVNVYLLGVFLYFNHQLLHDKLNEFFSEIESQNSFFPEQDPTEMFIDAWKIFALCHDIGYPFEKLLSTEGDSKEPPRPISKYIDFASRIEYDEAIRSLAICILATCICDRSNKTIGALLQRKKLDLHNWDCIKLEESVNENGSSKSSPIINDDELNEYVKLYGVQSFEDATALAPIIPTEGLVFFAHSNVGSKCYFYRIENGGIYCYKQHNTDTPKRDFILSPPDDFEIEVYCKNPAKTLSDHCNDYDFPVYGQDDWIDVARAFGEDIVGITTKRYYTCKDALVAIYQRICEYYDYTYSSMNYGDVKAEKFGNKKILKQCLIDDIGHVVDSCEGDADNLRETFDAAIKGITELLSKTDYQKEIVNRMAQISNQANSLLQTLYNALKVEHYCLKTLQKDDLKRRPLLFRTKKLSNRYVFLLTPLIYAHSTNVRHFLSHSNDLSSKIANNLSQMNIIRDDNLLPVQHYKSEWCAYDHGVISAHILLFLVSWRKQCKCSNNLSFISISQSNATAMSDTSCNDNVMAEALSAILVHNIYPAQYKNINDIDFSLSFDNHPLAYFGALCDSLQIWDRRLSADQSRIIIKNFNPTHHHVALTIKRNNIVITAETDNPKKTGKVQRDAMDQYLKGASPLVKINIIETPV